MSEEAWAEARGPDSAGPLSQDQLLRLSGILGIYQSLELFFSKPMARDWLTKPNDGPLFGGLRPVDAALAGGLPMIVQIRDHVDALLQGN
ncbi:hypothetical protein DC363_08750 [Thalassorhabdomicrobium marinisediminis]|uniref:Antitoxin Xre/MbcA/ParS-like toxin-binding domain-containing protein n=1 Tax=Thalassorhabdomicrobium marinisediminis TaxID=2170577 RepID=A0A2T7FWR2_9RHOB|nr:hypothetical protein DC363_08750 [Thalassorhabdomicrobium marinisediminis]